MVGVEDFLDVILRREERIVEVNELVQTRGTVTPPLWKKTSANRDESINFLAGFCNKPETAICPTSWALVHFRKFDQSPVVCRRALEPLCQLLHGYPLIQVLDA